MQILRPRALGLDSYSVSLPEDEGPIWDAVASYGLNDIVVRDHKVFVSAIGDNTGIDPLLENQSLVGVRWVFRSYTNAFSFLDGVLSNKTAGAGPIEVTIDNVQAVDALLLFGIAGTYLVVSGETLAGTEVYRHEQGLSGRTVSNWWSWLNDPFSGSADKVLVTGMPASVARIKITISGDQVTLGEMVLGDLVDVGATQMEGTSGEAVALSRVEFNAYGVLQRVKRPTRNEMTYRVFVDADRWRLVKPLMDGLQGEVVAAIGAVSRPSTIHLGVLGAVRWPEDWPDGYWYSFKIRGLS